MLNNEGILSSHILSRRYPGDNSDNIPFCQEKEPDRLSTSGHSYPHTGFDPDSIWTTVPWDSS